jgi:hypothetical protein
MMMRMSKGLGARWKADKIDEALATIVLQPRLRALVGAPLVRKAGGLVLEPLAAHATGPEAFQDRTGYEAFVNKVHVDDLLDDAGETAAEQLETMIRQGAKAAVELSRRLENEGRYRVLLSLDPELPTMTLRFFERRDGEPWGAEDPDAYQLEEVLMIDTGS